MRQSTALHRQDRLTRVAAAVTRLSGAPWPRTLGFLDAVAAAGTKCCSSSLDSSTIHSSSLDSNKTTWPLDPAILGAGGQRCAHGRLQSTPKDNKESAGTWQQQQPSLGTHTLNDLMPTFALAKLLAKQARPWQDPRAKILQRRCCPDYLLAACCTPPFPTHFAPSGKGAPVARPAKWSGHPALNRAATRSATRAGLRHTQWRRRRSRPCASPAARSTPHAPCTAQPPWARCPATPSARLTKGCTSGP